MTMHLQVQTEAFGSYTDIDLVVYRVAQMSLKVGVSHPACLSWVMYAAAHTMPLGIRNFIRFWDDAGTIDGVAQSSTNPLFEGFIDDVQPGEGTNEVRCTAYDPTNKVTNELTVMSVAWNAGDVGTGTPPVPGAGAFPRLVWNVLNDSDDDYAFERAHYKTVGNMIAAILEDMYHPLYWANAAPGDGTSAGNGTAYTGSELDTLTFTPQEKETFDWSTLRPAIDKLLRYYPQVRYTFIPGTRKWKFFNLTTAPAVTLTLNKSNDTNEIMALQLTRSLNDRYTAVRFHGPQALTQYEVTLSDGTLTDISDNPSLQNSIATCCDVLGKNRWQITDPEKRLMARILPSPTQVQTGDWNVVTAFTPQLLAYWPETEAGQAGWRAQAGYRFDFQRGIADFGDAYLYRFNETAAAGSDNPAYENPTDVKIIYAWPNSNLQVRYPETGYQGTAYTVANLQTEKQIYDEMLAVDYSYGQPITISSRIAQFQELAKILLEQHQDIVYTGSVILDGMRYDFSRLNKRVNIAGVDADGTAMTTGWEAINAMLTDVEYNFTDQLTTLTFSSDHAELCGYDVDLLKNLLRIKALSKVFWFNYGFRTIIRQRGGNERNGFDQFNTIHELHFWSNSGTDYVDPNSGVSPETGGYYDPGQYNYQGSGI